MTQTELFDQSEVSGFVVVLQVLEESTTTSNELQQTTAGVMVLLVAGKVARELVDASRDQRDLNLRGTGIAFLRKRERCGTLACLEVRVNADEIFHPRHAVLVPYALSTRGSLKPHRAPWPGSAPPT